MNSTKDNNTLTKKDKTRRKIIDTILNGTDHNLPTKYKKLHGRFDATIAIVIGINMVVILYKAIFPQAIPVELFKLSSYVTLLIFLVEFILRYISASATYPNENVVVAKFKYLVSFVGIIDIISIIPIVVPMYYAVNGIEIVGDELHLFMIFLFALMLKSIRYFKTFQFIIVVFRSVRKELLVGLFMSAILVFFSGTLMYYVETSAQPDKFSSIGQGFWWSIITYATVGYGDIYPITVTGKLLASLIVVIGIATIALPSGIISGAFIREMQSRKAEKKQKVTNLIPIDTGIYKYCPFCGVETSFGKGKQYCQSCGVRVGRKEINENIKD